MALSATDDQNASFQWLFSVQISSWHYHNLEKFLFLYVNFSGESTLDLCYASPEEIPEWQRPRCATGNRRKLITVETIPHCGQMSHGTQGHLAWMRWRPRSGGLALLVVSFSVLVSILLRSLSMSGVARLIGALRFQGSCSWLGERKGSWAVGYLCSCPGCAVTTHLEQWYLWHFRVLGESPACYRQLVVIFDLA